MASLIGVFGFFYQGIALWWRSAVLELKKLHDYVPLLNEHPYQVDQEIFGEGEEHAAIINGSDYDDDEFEVDDNTLDQGASDVYVLTMEDYVQSNPPSYTNDFTVETDLAGAPLDDDEDTQRMLEHLFLLWGDHLETARCFTQQNFRLTDNLSLSVYPILIAFAIGALVIYLKYKIDYNTDSINNWSAEFTVVEIEDDGEEQIAEDTESVSLDSRSTDALSLAAATATGSSPDIDEEKLINRSQVIAVSPELPVLEAPVSASRSSSPGSSPEHLSSLSDDMLSVAQVPELHLSDSCTFGPYTLESADLLDIEAITEAESVGEGELVPVLSEGSKKVKVMFRVTKRPKSTDIDVQPFTGGEEHAPTKVPEQIPDHLQRSFRELPSSGLSSPGVDECLTGFSTLSLQHCPPETLTSALSGTSITEDTMESCGFSIPQEAVPLLETGPTNVETLAPSSANHGNISTRSDQSSTPTPFAPTQPENILDQYPDTPSKVLVGKTVPTSSTFGITGIGEVSPSRIPIMVPAKDALHRAFKTSPLPKLRGVEKPMISAPVRKFFLDGDAHCDGELYLCEVFGPDPDININAEVLNALDDNGIDEVIGVFAGKETSENWKARYDNIDLLIAHLRLHAPEKHFDHFQEKIGEHLENILMTVGTTRSKLLVKAIIFLRDLVFFGSNLALSRENFTVLIHMLIPLTRSTQASKHIQNLTTKSLSLMLQAITTKSLITNFDLIFGNILSDKKMKGEKYACLQMIKFFVLTNKDKMNKSEMSQIVQKLVPFVAELSVDGFQKTRSEVVELYLIFVQLLRCDGFSEIEGAGEALHYYYSGLGSFLKSQVASPLLDTSY